MLTVTVEGPEPFATELGLSEHVGGRATTGVTLQDRFTVPLKPLTGAMVIVEVADPPAAIDAGESADAAIVKSGGGGTGLTVRLTDVSWLADPKVPVTVTVEVPTGVTAEVVMVRADVAAAAPGVTGLGTKAQLAPAGKLTAAQVSATALLKPFSAVTEIV